MKLRDLRIAFTRPAVAAVQVRALVHFPDGRQRVLTLSEIPEIGRAVVVPGLEQGAWTWKSFEESSGEVDGQQYEYEAWVMPSIARFLRDWLA